MSPPGKVERRRSFPAASAVTCTRNDSTVSSGIVVAGAFALDAVGPLTFASVPRLGEVDEGDALRPARA